MRLTDKEVRLIAQVRSTSTGKVTAVTYRGEIRAIKTEIDAETFDRAHGQDKPWAGKAELETQPEKRYTVKNSEPAKSPKPIETPTETKTQEAAPSPGTEKTF